jgi:hypothetical protein
MSLEGFLEPQNNRETDRRRGVTCVGFHNRDTQIYCTATATGKYVYPCLQRMQDVALG